MTLRDEGALQNRQKERDVIGYCDGRKGTLLKDRQTYTQKKRVIGYSKDGSTVRASWDEAELA